MKLQLFVKNFGPGILLAATAIGVSHLVQSVQAGAKYGYIMILAIIFAHLIKYPFFEFATKYTNVKKTNLLQGYFEYHPFLLYGFLFLNFVGIIAIQSVVTLVGAGILANIFPVELSIQTWSLISLIFCSIILLLGHYQMLDKIIKFVILTLTITTLISAIFAITSEKNFDPSLAHKFNFSASGDILFLIAFLGWMPCPLDCAAWNSLWVEKKDKSEHPDLKTALLDLRIGYVIMAITAILFLTLGAALIYGSGQEIPSKSGPFISMLFSLYTSTLGKAAFFIVATTAFFTMFSTIITCLDGFTRVSTKSCQILCSKNTGSKFDENKIYNYFLLLSVIIPFLVLTFFLKTMASLINFATIIAFLTTPILAYFNYKLITHDNFPAEHRPGRKMKIIAQTNIFILLLFSLWFVLSRFY